MIKYLLNRKKTGFRIGLFIALSLFIFTGYNCSSKSKRLKETTSRDGVDTTGSEFTVKNIDIDAAGTYAVSGSYKSRSTSARILKGIYAEQMPSGKELIVTLYPKFRYVGKDPVNIRVFAFQGWLEDSYKYQTITVKMFNAEKTIKIER